MNGPKSLLSLSSQFFVSVFVFCWAFLFSLFLGLLCCCCCVCVCFWGEFPILLFCTFTLSLKELVFLFAVEHILGTSYIWFRDLLLVLNTSYPRAQELCETKLILHIPSGFYAIHCHKLGRQRSPHLMIYNLKGTLLWRLNFLCA